MGGSCSSQRRHHDNTSDGRQAEAATATAGGSDASHGCTCSIRRRGGRFRSGISRFCGGSEVRVNEEKLEVGILFYIYYIPCVSLCALETDSLANSQHTSYISPNTTLFLHHTGWIIRRRRKHQQQHITIIIKLSSIAYMPSFGRCRSSNSIYKTVLPHR